ncbi:hypothetical protein FOQG_07677 [Fusarium oxysporum f. sp. raphani 54005]|uniref:Uncharacterized protein n=2 Tax=Fusarium oxysporum TaxID=5507 RepID=X0CED3_FUSOX|nr:hypothetical protein FOVG_12113 [Fusarium oxysporum f. sp. pisi HDV247]EXK89588.1 hypothetical protein FOQG_07677 [Fusarium oxysporum f. sp. raphani 54005]
MSVPGGQKPLSKSVNFTTRKTVLGAIVFMIWSIAQVHMNEKP